MAKKKWYAVTAGRAVGLFDNWLLVAPLVIGVSESHYVSFTSEEDAWEAYEEARGEGNIRILPAGGKSKSSRSCNPSRSDEHHSSATNADPEPSQGCNAILTTAVTSPPEMVTLVGGKSPASSKAGPAAAPPFPLALSLSSKATRSIKTDEFVRLYVASSSKTESEPTNVSRSKGSPGGGRTTPVLPKVRRIVVQTPSFLCPYPDEPESPDDEQPVSPSPADLLSPLTSPRLHTPEPYEGPLSPPPQAQKSPGCRQHSTASSIMLAMRMAPSQVTGGTLYDAVADPRSPLAKTASIPRDSRPFRRPSPNYSLYGALVGPD
ncbi:uncharacterized protein BT62DRAFT_1072946 [Guyanagaster necrorhizus]|uniref:Ribonuclease H1 N-terminal domain-containing protein n=1 Tax=Guyanagaster necrorhizus TaxID=856835 RepID=A0A9P7W175_9AGAR|nr:uncharacterized protein BT62DRAFT_1072946 [Guyanagaster necrorhizus MCA 3950]KAG7449501.1 hypothetical protein BT62DRAFT_1072946 [Guyanagaster necrorhizus MCA 3950]